MFINKQIIEKLNPCMNRYNNYLEHYSEFNGTIEEFLALDKISYEDKVWVIVTFLTKEQTINWAISCIKSALHTIEDLPPYDYSIKEDLDKYINLLENPTQGNNIAILRNVDYKAFATTTVTIATIHTFGSMEKQRQLNLEFLKQVLRDK